MTKILLPRGKADKLKREASGSIPSYEQLCREAIARRWLKEWRIPSWRNPGTPSGNCSADCSRYSIMLSDGSRFLVSGVKDTAIPFDSVAAAKCFAVLGVSMDEDCLAGEPVGVISLSMMEPGINHLSFTGTEGTLKAFLEEVRNPDGYTTALLKFSIRLLILGEPDAPARGTENVRAFRPAGKTPREV